MFVMLRGSRRRSELLARPPSSQQRCQIGAVDNPVAIRIPSARRAPPSKNQRERALGAQGKKPPLQVVSQTRHRARFRVSVLLRDERPVGTRGRERSRRRRRVGRTLGDWPGTRHLRHHRARGQLGEVDRLIHVRDSDASRDSPRGHTQRGSPRRCQCLRSFGGYGSLP